MKTKQEIFNIVWNGLKGQGFQRAFKEDGTCAYRGINGLKCAVGHLIPDELYKPEMDSPMSLGSIIQTIGENEDDYAYFSELQRAHDNGSSPELMKELLLKAAKSYYLGAPKETTP